MHILTASLRRLRLALATITSAFILASSLPVCAQSNLPDSPAAANPVAELRAMFLRNSAEELQLSPELAAAPVRGMIMDIGFESATVTVVGFPTGDASIYFSTGGGFIGGGNHETIAQAAKAWVAEAQSHLAELSKVEDYPLPARGEVKLYVMTPQGLLAAQASEAELIERRHPLWQLFYRGQEVITQYRLVQQKQKQVSR